MERDADRDADLAVVFRETMSPTGFMAKIRENEVSEQGFEELMMAIDRIAEQTVDSRCLDRLYVACLYEAAWEIDNTVEHYRSRDRALGEKVSKMAERLRLSMQRHLWRGLEDYYRDPSTAPTPEWSCP